MHDHDRKTPKLLSSVKQLSPDIEPFSFEFINGKDIKAKRQPWLWPGFIPLNGVTLFAGEGGIGKSHLLLEIAAKISTGEKFSACGFEHQFKKGKVIFLTAEDDFEYTVKPKLIAAKCDYEQFEFLTMTSNPMTGKRKFVDLTTQLGALKESILNFGGCSMIVIDPILYFIGSLKENYNAEVSNFLGELGAFAKELGTAVILNKHFRKKSSGTNITSAMDEVGGAGSWINSPRVSWAITVWHDDLNVRIVSNLKANIMKKQNDCYAYKLESCFVDLEDGEKVETCKLVWLDKMISITANEAVNSDAYEKSKKQVAYDFIIKYLTDNGQSVSMHVKDASSAIGIKLKTFESAVKDIKDEKLLKIESGIGRGAKLWTLIESDNY